MVFKVIFCLDRMEYHRKPEKTWKQYALNIIHVIRGEEQFVDTPPTPAAEAFLGLALMWTIFILIIAFFVCYGAARLSWCYNTFYGEPAGTKMIFSILCFFFPNFYYPFYAIFLDPVCGRKASSNRR